MEYFYEDVGDFGQSQGGPQSQMECETCGGKDFYSEGGFFYCKVCNVQSQQSRVYVEDEDAQGSQAFNLRKVNKLREPRAKSQKYVAPDQLLSTWEVYNLMLKVMTDKLIELGFPSLLKDKVFQIWKQYLLRREVILVPNSKTVSVTERKINLRAIHGDKPGKSFYRSRLIPKDQDKVVVDANPSVTKRRRTYAMKAAFHQEYLEQQRKEAEASQPPKAPYQFTAQSKIILKEFPDSRQTFKNFISGRNDIDRSVGYNTTKKLLGTEMFGILEVIITLFVACRQIGCRVLFTDIHRLYLDGTLNLRSLRPILGEEVYDQYNNASDACCKEYKMYFDVFKLCSSIENLISYVGIQYFAYPTFEEFLPKFIDDLNLPRELEGLVVQFHKMFTKEDFEQTSYKDTLVPLQECRVLVEIEILSTILLISKMLFGFDDVTEIHQWKFARAVNQLMTKYGENQNHKQGVAGDNIEAAEWNPDFNHCFVVGDWFSYLRTRIHLLDRELFSTVNYKYGIGWETNLSRTSEVINRFMAYARNSRRKSKESVEELRSFFEEATISSSGVYSEVPDYVSLPLPTVSPIQQYFDAAAQAPNNVSFPNYVNNSTCEKLLRTDFSKTRIDFVYNPYKYIGILEKGGYKVEILSGDGYQHSKKIEENTNKKTLFLFQPYKQFNYSVIETHRVESESMKFLHEVIETYVFDVDAITTIKSYRSRPIVNMLIHLSRSYRLRSAHNFIPFPNIEQEDHEETKDPLNILYFSKQVEIVKKVRPFRVGYKHRNTKRQRLIDHLKRKAKWAKKFQLRNKKNESSNTNSIEPV